MSYLWHGKDNAKFVLQTDEEITVILNHIIIIKINSIKLPTSSVEFR